jgi:probable HAF family extracellular repeat protein
MRGTPSILGWILFLSLGSYDSPAEPVFTGLGGTSQYDRSYANGVSADGSVVVGDIYSEWSGGYVAFRWTEAGGMTVLPDLPGGSSLFRSRRAFGCSPNGTVIVGEGTSGTGPLPNEACRWTASDYQAIGLGVPLGCAFAVCGNGSTIVGTNEAGAFRWTQSTGMVGIGAGVFSEASDISGDGTVIVGNTEPSSGAYRWTEGAGVVSLGGPAGSYATSVSADGTVVVGASGIAGMQREAFRWTQQTGMVGLGFLPGGADSVAHAVSSGGRVVVGSTDSGPFVWDACNGMRRLQDVLVNELGLDLTGWDLLGATDVSADGLTVVGYGTNPSGRTEAWMARLPAPRIPDFDSDDDVDGFDFLRFSICFNGSNKPPRPECENPTADIDGDGDVDGFDFLTFSNVFNGSNNPPRCP